MQHSNIFRAAGMIGVLFLATISARADEIYSYIGPTFESNGYSCGVATFNGLNCGQLKNDNITVSLDLTNGLGDNYSGIVSAADINSWVMSAAGVTLGSAGAGQDLYVGVATDGTGAITDWAIFSDSGLGGVALLTTSDNDGNVTTPWQLSGSDDSLYSENCLLASYNCQSLAIVTSAAGTWTGNYAEPVSPTPEPVWDAIIALGVFIPAGLWQRRRLRQRKQRDLQRELFLVATEPKVEVLRTALESAHYALCEPCARLVEAGHEA